MAREAGAGSVVLLKNQNVLPVTSTAGKIAVVGPLNKAKKICWEIGPPLERLKK